MQLLKNRRSVPAALVFLLASVQVSPVLAQPSGPEAPTPYRAKRLFYGCWEVKRPGTGGSRWPDTATTLCFHLGRALGGATFDAGDGWDFCERWRVDGQRLAMRDNYGHSERCLYAFSEDGQTLILRDCRSAGDWRRRNDLSRDSWPCRMQGRVEPVDDADTQP